MSISISKLRENIYNLFDDVLRNGKPLFVERKGKRLKISVVGEVNKLANLKKRKALLGDPDEIIHIDWSSEWKYKS